MCNLSSYSSQHTVEETEDEPVIVASPKPSTRSKKKKRPLFVDNVPYTLIKNSGPDDDNVG